MNSIAAFGSAALRENDHLSDSDLLIVCPEGSRKELYKKYSELGYSVTLLSLSQLKHMQRQGSLFVQHLKRDAKILIDDQEELREFLDGCIFTPPPKDELVRCENTIRFIASLPSTFNTNSWKADFLYCVSRDYLVKKLAERNILAFGVKDICRQSFKNFGISEKEFSSFLELRQSKANYRSTTAEYIDSSKATHNWLSTLSKAFSLSFEPSKYWDYELIANRNFSSTYEKLRTLEVLYLMCRSRGYVHPDHEMIMSYICNPNLYGSSKKCNDKVLGKYINDIYCLVANKAMHRATFPLRFASL